MPEDEFLETRSLPGPSTDRVSWTTNGNEHQASVKIPVSVNFNKVTASNNKKHSYEKSFGNGTSSNSKKRNYEELFGDISNFLDTDVPGVVID